ncbi:MAG: S8 family serine peptidase [Bacteroidales bacterium]|nr:S8 family serine peptidase [Bacteroidales bacterium]
MQGTSMASPVMTGVVALWLQHNPSLNVDSVRTLLHATARKDMFTGDIPTTGSNDWGWGKANAFAGLPPTTVPMHYVKVSVDNYQHGIVSGNGLVAEGRHVIAATPLDGFTFSVWNDGVTDNPRVVSISSDTMFVANFNQAPCDTIRQFPWNIVVSESLLNCWDNFSYVDSLLWLPFPPIMISAAMPGTDVVDNWLVSPYLIPDANCSLIYSCGSMNSDSLAIEVITDNGDTVRISDELITPLTDELQVSLSQYAGQLIRFAFHHHATVVSSAIMLSAIKVDYVQGIDDVEFGNISLATSGLQIKVAGAAGTQLNVYDVMGRCVLSSPDANMFSACSPNMISGCHRS